MKKIISTIVFLVVTITANAQQESLFSFYRNHMNLVNPAYAGAEDETLINSSYRKQWAGIEEAPETQALSFGTSLGKSIGINSSTFETCVNDGKYIKWTSNVAAASAKADVNGTPTIFVNGKQLDRNTEYGDQAKFRAALAAGGVK